MRQEIVGIVGSAGIGRTGLASFGFAKLHSEFALATADKDLAGFPSASCEGAFGPSQWQRDCTRLVRLDFVCERFTQFFCWIRSPQASAQKGHNAPGTELVEAPLPREQA